MARGKRAAKNETKGKTLEAAELEALFTALAELAAKVQRARTEREVLALVGEGLLALGLHCAAFSFDGSNLILSQAPAEPVAAILGRFVHPLEGSQLLLSSVPEAARAIHEGRSVYVDDLLGAFPLLSEQVPAAERVGFEAEAARLGFRKGVLAPLRVKGQPWGLLLAASARLSSGDAAALGLFALQVSSALESALAIADLEKKNRQLAVVQALAAAGSELAVGGSLSNFARSAAEAMHSDSAAIHLLDAEHGELVWAGAARTGAEVSRKYSRLSLVSTPVGQTASTLRPRGLSVARDLPEASRAMLLALGVLELAVVPLHVKGRLAGTLTLGRARPQPYSADELAAAEMVAGQLAIQIENTQLRLEEKRRVRQLSLLFELSRVSSEATGVAPLVARVLEEVVTALAVDGGAIHLLEGQALVVAGRRGEPSEVSCAASCQQPLGECACLKVARDRRSMTAGLPASPAGPPRVAVTPLIANDQLIGTLCVRRRGEPPISEEEVKLLESCGGPVGMAIEHARHLETEHQRAEQFRLLHEVGRAITASLDLEQTLVAAATSIARMVGASSAFIWLYDPATRRLQGGATSAPEFRKDFLEQSLALEDTALATLCLRNRTPVWTSDTGSSPDVHPELCKRYGAGNLMAIPLLLRNEAIGAVVISDTRRGRSWSEAEIEQATLIARLVAVAVANARLFVDLKRSYDELARTQEELVKRERLAALGELAAVVAHEVRNPLGVIFNSLGALRRAPPTSEEAPLLLKILGEEADRLNRIVGDLLDFAKPHEPTLEPAALEEILNGAIEAAAGARESCTTRIECKVGGGLGRVWVDGRMLRQALVNLVENALQAVPTGGNIVVRAARTTRAGRPTMELQVVDNGPGVKPEMAEQIFQPFFTTKASGTGLGLAVVKRIVEAHRGELTLTPTAGGGATFNVSLPIDAAPGAAQAPT